MAEILLLGEFGHGSPGGEAQCASICAGLGDHRIVVASANPAESERLHGVPAIDDSLRGVRQALGSVDALLVGGGTTLSSTVAERPGLPRLALVMQAARRRGIPIGLVGVGAGELRGWRDRRLVRWIASRADLLVLRDEESAAVLTDAGAAGPFWIGAEISWFEIDPALAPAESDSGQPTITVAVSRSAGTPALYDALADALGVFLESHLIQIQPWRTNGPAGDQPAAEYLLGRLRGEAKIIAAPDTVPAAARDYAGTDLVVALRLHAIVAAGLARARCLAVAFEPKMSALARRVGQVWVPPHSSGDVLRESVRAALGGPLPDHSGVLDQVDLAQRTIDMVRLLVGHGAVERPDLIRPLEMTHGGGTW